MKRCLSLVLLLGLLLPMLLVLEPAPSAAQASTQANPPKPDGSIVVLRADPNVSTHRVSAPARTFMPQRIQSATITIVYLPAGATDKFDYSCLAWPAAAQTAFTYAADIWETLLDSSVTIVIHACWADMEEGILGGGAPDDYYRNFSGTPVPDTWYPVALANALHGSDLDPTRPDMHLVYSKKFQDTGQWYFGTDGNTSVTQYDFTSVVLHEIAHGLGFAGSMQFSTDGSEARWGYGSGYPFSYDRFTEDGSGNALINTAIYPNPSAALAGALTSDNIWFDGPYANIANGGGRVKLYAPSTWRPGSSYSHLDEIYNGTPNSLMTYALSKGESSHSPGPVAMGILQDVGWTTGGAAAPPTVTSITPNTGANTGNVPVTIAGSDFQAGAAVKLTKTGQPDINATGVAVVSAGQITANFDLTGTATGAWNVVVTNPDAQSGTLSNGFTVTFSGKTWTGAVSTDWHTSGNWDPTGVPVIGDDVLIPDVVRDPIISTGNAAVNNLMINSGATVDLTDRTLTVEGTLTNNGTLKQTQDVAQDVSTEFLRITNQAGNQTKYYGVDITPEDNTYFSSPEAWRLVELTLDSLPARSVTPPSAAIHAPDAPVSLVVDDGTHEAAYGVNDNTAMTGKQFIWLTRFTPEAATYPFTLDEIWVMFDSFGGGANVNVGDAIDLVVYEDSDGDPTNGATWLATIPVTVQAVDGTVWSVYSLSSPILLEGPGDVIIAAINRYITSGVSPRAYPATFDTTSGQDRSWIGWWTADPPSPPLLPPGLRFDLLTGDHAGNWLIRGYGSNSGEAPNIEISPVSFEETLAVDEILMQTLIISNTGTAPLTFVIDVQNEGFAPALCAPAIMESNVSATPARDPGLHALAWTGAASMPTARARLAGATADGCLLYAIGGSLIGISSFFNNNEVYDPQSNSWATLAPMPTARNGVGAAAVDGVIYVPGGYNGSSLSVHEAYNITSNSWSSKAALPVALSGGAVVAANGKVYHIGGNTGSSYTDAIYEYNPATNAWSTKAAAPEAIAYAGGVVLNGYIYIAGGWLSTSSASTRFWRYDPVGNSWTVLAPMNQGRQSPGLVAAGGYIYAFGGGVGWTALNTTEQYNPATNTWTSRPDSPLAEGRIGMATGWVRGKIWGAGGTTGSGAEDDNEYLDEGYADNCGGVTPAWLSINPATGQVPVGSSLTVDVVFDATGLTAGDYTADLVITSNDPDENLVIVPVTMHVTDTINTPPTLSGLPDQTVPMNGSADNAIDLWAYADDAEDAVDALTFAIVNAPDPNAGVTIDSNRYIDINPTAGWTGQTDVEVQVQDTGGLTDTDTFRVTVSGGVPSTSVTVAVSGNQFCADRTAGVKRCFDIDPTTPMSATVRFYFSEVERNGQSLNDLLVFHYEGDWMEEPGPYTCGGAGDAQFVEVQNVDDFSLFVLDSGEPALPDRYVIFLPLVLRRWPPLPGTPVLNAISNADGDGSYAVTWNAAYLAATYTLQEATQSNFSDGITVYSGPNTSRAISGRDVGTYYYRVRASNAYGDSNWSNTRSVVVTQPLPPCVQYDFAESNVQYYIYSSGRSWSFTAGSDMRVKRVETKSILATLSGITFTIQVRINGNTVASWTQYVNDSYYKAYYHSANVEFDLAEGDTITYYIKSNTGSPVAAIRGVSYVKLCR